MISDGAIRIGEMHFAGPVPDDGDNPTERKWGVDGTWMDPKLLIAGRREENEYMIKMGVFEVADEKECHDNGCKPLKLKWVDKMKGEKCRSRLVCREIKRAKDRDEHLGPEDVFSPMPPSEGLKMLVSTMMTGHNDGNHANRERTFSVKLAGGLTHISLKGMNRRASWPDSAGACMERETQRPIWGDTWSEVLKDGSMKVGTACPAFFCTDDGDLKGLCHGDDFCVVARRKQLQIFWKVLERRIEVQQSGYIGFGANDEKELKILNRTIKSRCAERRDDVGS